MSRVGKKPIPLPSGVKISVTDRLVTVEAGGNRLTYTHQPIVSVIVQENAAIVERQGDDRTARAMHGLTRALINNMVIGVTEGFTKELQINGVGWTAQVQGGKVLLNVGYADVKQVAIREGVEVEAKGNRITVRGADKQAVGQTAAEIRAQRKPEPYNGKGIQYVGEQIIRKQGKAFAAGAA